MNRIFPVKRRFRASAPNTKLDLSFGQAPFTPDEEPYFEFVREAVVGTSDLSTARHAVLPGLRAKYEVLLPYCAISLQRADVLSDNATPKAKCESSTYVVRRTEFIARCWHSTHPTKYEISSALSVTWLEKRVSREAVAKDHVLVRSTKGSGVVLRAKN